MAVFNVGPIDKPHWIFKMGLLAVGGPGHNKAEKGPKWLRVEMVTFKLTFPEISVVPPVSKDRSVA